MIQLPESFETRMKMILGPEYRAFSHSLSSPVSHSIRINPLKIGIPGHLEKINYCNTGFYLQNRPVYTLDPHFHAGAYYVQESSSMFLEQFILPAAKKNLKVLDLCAAPGGKSTHLSSLLTGESLLVSNEVIQARSQVLSENLRKWGNPNVIVTSNDPKDFSRLAGFFDIIVVDAPCSGEGLFRRDPSAIGEWSESNAVLCSQRQRRILADAWPALAEGGMLVYSTCTYNPAENEENMEWLAGFAPVEPVRLPLSGEWGVKTVDAAGLPCYRFYPQKVRGEGFFIAAVRKKEAEPAIRSQKSKSSLPVVSRSEQALLNETLLKSPLALLKFGEQILAWPESQASSLEMVRSHLRIVHAGLKVGEIVRGAFNPAHELALSPLCNKSNFPCSEVSLEQAISFLKKEDVQLPFTEKGWNLVVYKGQPIGWAKNIGSRYNNNYPKEWRIRMSTSEFTGARLLEEAEKFPFHA